MWMIKQYLTNILISLDQLLNTLRGGDPDETLSSVAAKNLHKREWHMLGSFLEMIDHGHLKRAIENDEGSRDIWVMRRKRKEGNQ